MCGVMCTESQSVWNACGMEKHNHKDLVVPIARKEGHYEIVHY